MTTLDTYKQQHNISSLPFFPSKKDTGRFVSSYLDSDGNSIMVVTTENYDPKGEDFIAPHPDPSITDVVYLCNAKPAFDK